MAISTYLLIITLNANEINALIKRRRVARLDLKTRTYNMLATRGSLQGKGHTEIENERMEKIFHANGNDSKVGVAICISDKINFKTKSMNKDKERYYIMIKWPIHQDDITVIKIYLT